MREATAAKFKPHHIQASMDGIKTAWLGVANITAVLTIMGAYANLVRALLDDLNKEDSCRLSRRARARMR